MAFYLTKLGCRNEKDDLINCDIADQPFTMIRVIGGRVEFEMSTLILSLIKCNLTIWSSSGENKR